MKKTKNEMKWLAKTLATRINKEFEGELDPDTYEKVTANLLITDEEFENLYYMVEDNLE